jgi:hypothetical protein
VGIFTFRARMAWKPDGGWSRVTFEPLFLLPGSAGRTRNLQESTATVADGRGFVAERHGNARGTESLRGRQRV